MSSARKEHGMLKKTLLMTAVAGLLAVGSAAAIADNADGADDAPALQTQLRQRLQIHDAAEVPAGIEPIQNRVRSQVHQQSAGDSPAGDAVMTQTQNRERLQLHDPAEAPVLQERVQARVRVHDGNQTQAGNTVQTRTRIQDPDACAGQCCAGQCDGTGGGPGYATGECDGEGPANKEGPADGTGHQHGNGGSNGGGNGK